LQRYVQEKMVIGRGKKVNMLRSPAMGREREKRRIGPQNSISGLRGL